MRQASAKPVRPEKPPNELPPRLELPKYEMLAELARQHHAPPAAAAAYVLLNIVSNELTEASAMHFARHDLSRGRFVLLMLLWCEEDHTLTPLELANKAGVRPATVTGLLGGLERDGYVVRAPQENDRRMITVRLLPKGRALLEDFFPDHFGRITRVMAGISGADLDALSRVLTAIRDNLDVFRNT